MILRASSLFQSALRSLIAAMAVAQSELIARNAQETVGLNAKKRCRICRHPISAADGDLAGPLRPLQRGDRRRDPAQPRLAPDGQPLAYPGRRPARRVLLRLSCGRAEGGRAPLRPEHHPARPGVARPVERPALGRAVGRPPPQPGQHAERGRPGREPRWLQLAAHRARGHDHLRAARPRLHLPPLVRRARTRAPSPAWSRRSPT